MGQMSPGEKNDILSYVKKHPEKTIRQVATEFGRTADTVSRLLKDLRPTTELARATLLSRAHELVERVTEKADVDQLIDVLSRPNVGVLEPIASKAGGGGTSVGILVSVNQGTLAAVTQSQPVLAAADAELIPEKEGKRISIGSVPVGQLYGQ